jgi:hypothetical protein
MDDEDEDKRQMLFEDKKRERERQLKERKKRLDGSDSEVDEGGVKKGKQTQVGAYNSLTFLGTTTCTTPSQTKGTPETEHLSSELNKIELNNTTNSPSEHKNNKQTDLSEPQVNSTDQTSSLTDDNDDLDIDFLSDEDDSSLDISQMQENSLDAFLNVCVDGGVPASTDQSAYQQENPVDSASVVTQEESRITLKEEPVTEEIRTGNSIAGHQGGVFPEVPRSKPCAWEDSHQSKRRKRIHEGFEGTI